MLYIVVPFGNRITCNWKFFTMANKKQWRLAYLGQRYCYSHRSCPQQLMTNSSVSVERTPEPETCQTIFIVGSEIHNWGQNHLLYLLVKWKLWYDQRSLHTPLTSAEFFFSKLSEYLWPTIREEHQLTLRKFPQQLPSFHWTMTATAATVTTHILLFFDDALWQRSKIS